MWLTINNLKSIELEDEIIVDVLNLYPEEKLFERSTFKEALDGGSMEFSDLVAESEKCIIPWQMFLLNRKNLQKQLIHIEDQRQDKISSKLMAKRKGSGEVTSKRIIDRLIRLQNYICDNNTLPKNKFCGSLISLSDDDAVEHIFKYFDINKATLLGFNSKEKSFNYLVTCFENNNINISQGVLTHKILPNSKVVDSNVYKSTSGFVVKDDRMPFIFLPREINPDESVGRHIFTLIYLIALIGLGEYEYVVKKDFDISALPTKGKLGRIYKITSKFLLPESVTDELIDKNITVDLRDELSEKYKITPTAVAVILMLRQVISKSTYQSLLPPPFSPTAGVKQIMRTPHIDTSVRKFSGAHGFAYINEGIRNGSIKNTQAQYLLFGSINKMGFKKYRERLGI